MRTLALLLLLGCATVAQAQPPKSYTPGTPPRAGEETIRNARVVSVDRAGSRLTVRGVDVKADSGSNETFTVAAPAASRLADLKPGMEVLLTLRGTTVVDVKVSVASGGEGGNVIRGARPPARATGTASPATRTTRPAAGSSPQPAAGRPVTGTAPATVPVQTGPIIGVVPVVGPPSPAPYATPFPTPRPQGTPIPVGTPRPVLLPSDAPSPSQTPTPSPSPQAP